MSQSLKSICGDKLGASDGEIGHVKDFYFDDHRWVVRYLVADTGSWLTGKLVLITPHALGSLFPGGKQVIVNLTRQQIENCPSIDSHKPVSRQYEEEYYRYYGWPDYWRGDGVWGMSGFPIVEAGAIPYTSESQPQRDSRPGLTDSRLQSAQAVIGYQIQAGEDTVGHVTDFMMDSESWVITGLVINLGNRFTGKKVLLAPNQVHRISYEESKVFVNVTKEALELAPSFDEKHTHSAPAIT